MPDRMLARHGVRTGAPSGATSTAGSSSAANNKRLIRARQSENKFTAANVAPSTASKASPSLGANAEHRGHRLRPLTGSRNKDGYGAFGAKGDTKQVANSGSNRAAAHKDGNGETQAKAAKKKKRNNKHNSIVPDVIEERHRGSDDVDTYDKGKYLGKGGFARCYQMTSRKTGIIYAGKVVAKSSLKKTKAQQKLVAEIKIHQHLHNPNVVRFYRSFQDKHNVYILLELCSNQSLMELMKRRKRLTEPEVRYYFLQILEAVQYLHRNNVIHRDLKLGNLFLNENLQVKLGDMGLSTKLDSADEKKKTICGTPNYIAPEVISGSSHSFEVDIWSLGVILFTMLIGKPPFETKDVKATYKRIKRGSYCFPDSKKISRDARLLIESLLRVDPKDRPSLSQIRNHSFFTRPGTITPLKLPMSALESAPSFAASVPRSITGVGVPQQLAKRKEKGDPRAPPSPQLLVRVPSKVQVRVKGTKDSPRNIIINSKVNLAPQDEIRSSVDNSSTPVKSFLPGKRNMVADASDNCLIFQDSSTKDPYFPSSLMLSRPTSAADMNQHKHARLMNRDMTERPHTAHTASATSVNSRVQPKISSRHLHADRLAALNERLGKMEIRAFAGSSRNRRSDDEKHLCGKSSPVDPMLAFQARTARAASDFKSENYAPSTMTAVSSTRSSLGSSSSTIKKDSKSESTIIASKKKHHPASLVASSQASTTKMSTLKVMHEELSRSLSVSEGGLKETGNYMAHANQGPYNLNSEAKDKHRSHHAKYRRKAQRVDHNDGRFNMDGEMAASSSYDNAVEEQMPVVAPKVWVVRHVDYTRKYGFGYLLSNGAVGVYFNDSTKIILSPNNSNFEYIERVRSSSSLSQPPRHAHTLENYPDTLKKKVTLLVHFKAHLCGTEKEASSKTSAKAEEGARSTSSDGGVAVTGSGGGDAAAPADGMTYVKKWVRTSRCLLFRMSDRSVQVAFFDNTEVILSQAGWSSTDNHHGSITLTYVDKDKSRKSYSLQGIMDSSKAHILKRLQYTKTIIHELLSGKLSNPKGTKKSSSSKSENS